MCYNYKIKKCHNKNKCNISFKKNVYKFGRVYSQSILFFILKHCNKIFNSILYNFYMSLKLW